MRGLLRWAVKWTALTALAVVLGTSIGAAYATTFKAPVVEEAAAPPPDDALVETEVGLRDRTAPPAPALRTPADGAFSSWRPVFAWDPVEDASNVVYALQISTDPGFPSEATTTVLNLREPQWRPERPFPPLVEHHWRVYALDAGLNQGPWSAPRSFTPLLPVTVEVDDDRAAVEVDVLLPPT